MDNAAEALKMAGAVLLFVIALSVAINAFGQARQTADIILDYRDRETVYIDGELYYKATGTEREVGMETAIPTIIRAYLENYKVVFNNLSTPIYYLKENDGTRVPKYILDLETNNTSSTIEYKNAVLATNEAKTEFLCGILYRKFKDENGEFTSTYKADFEKKFNISLDGCDSLYSQLSRKKLIEYLGVYYQNDEEDVPEANKTEKRIITYKLVSD